MMTKTNGMVDISEKNAIQREATAVGKIYLNRQSINAIKEKTNPKGDVLENAKLAAIVGAKKTPELVFMCHPIQLSSVKVRFEVTEETVTCKVTTKTTDRTGVEIEAVAAVMNALLAIFDLSKRYEKDQEGQYKDARITDIRVEQKIKQNDTIVD